VTHHLLGSVNDPGRYRVGCQCCIGFPFDLAERAGVLATVKDKGIYPAYRGPRIFTTPELGVPQSGGAGRLRRDKACKS
jgi:hypothetical protein